MSHAPPPGPGIRLSSQLGQQITNFEQQPNVGGLGIVDSAQAGQGQGQGQGQYQSLVCLSGIANHYVIFCKELISR
jgi:hypothetical protein